MTACVGSSFVRAQELHKIVAGCSAFAIQTLTLITHGSTVLPSGPTSSYRDSRTIKQRSNGQTWQQNSVEDMGIDQKKR